MQNTDTKPFLDFVGNDQAHIQEVLRMQPDALVAYAQDQGFAISSDRIPFIKQMLESSLQSPQELSDLALEDVAGGHYEPKPRPGNPPPYPKR